jgi:hypothetical protein
VAEKTSAAYGVLGRSCFYKARSSFVIAGLAATHQDLIFPAGRAVENELVIRSVRGTANVTAHTNAYMSRTRLSLECRLRSWRVLRNRGEDTRLNLTSSSPRPRIAILYHAPFLSEPAVPPAKAGR